MEQKEKIFSQFGVKFWIISAAIVVVISGVKEAADLVTQLFLSIFLAAIFYAPFNWLQKKGMHISLALSIIILGITVISFAFVGLLTASVASFNDKIPFYEERLEIFWNGFNQFAIEKGLITTQFNIADYINAGLIMKFAGNVFSGFGGLLSNSLVILLLVIFLLLEISAFERKINLINRKSLTRINKIIHSLNAYFGTKAIISLITGVLVSISLAIIGVDFPLLWGFLAFLLNFIPNIGSIIAAIPAVLLSLVQIGIPSAIAAAIAFLIINIVVGNILEPSLLGRSLGLSPLIVFVSLIFWGWLLGTVGMLLATPLTMAIKIIFDNMDETKHIGLMLGDESSIKNYKK